MKIKHKNKESGQALVEFALVVSILFLIIFGIIQYGIIYNAKIVITSAAREGARKAAVTANDTDIQNTIQSAVSSLYYSSVVKDTRAKGELSKTEKDALSDTAIYWIIDPPSGGLGTPVTIYVRCKIKTTLPVISSEYVIISSSATMRKEHG